MTSKASLRDIQRKRIQLAQAQGESSPEVRDAHLHAEHKLRERLEVFFVQLFAFLTSGQLPAELTKERKPVSRRRWAAFTPHGHEPNLTSALQVISKCLPVEWAFPRVLNPKSDVPEMEFYLPNSESRHSLSQSAASASALGQATELGSSASTLGSATDLASSFQNNSWGLSEPNPETSELVEGETIDGFLIPALAFDQQGARLGRGKGYFDKYLSRFASVNSANEIVSRAKPAADVNAGSVADSRVGSAADQMSGSAADHGSSSALQSGPKLKTKIGIAFDDQILSENLVTEAHDITMDIVLSESRLLVSHEWWKHHSEKKLGTRITLRQAFPGAELFVASPSNSIERA